MYRFTDLASLQAETAEKERRVWEMLERQGCGSLLITRRDNFAWLSGGGRAVVSYAIPTSPVYLLLTPTRKYAIGFNMDVPRTMDEELAGLGYEPVSLPTFGKSPDEAAKELAAGRLGADDTFPGAVDLGQAVVRLHEPYTPQEIARYREVGREAGEVVRELAGWVQPGMTERHVLGHMWGLFVEHGFDGNCMFVVSDDRIGQYRHAVPGEKKIENRLILAPAVSKHGLHVLISRLVYFKPPTEDQRRRQTAVMTLQAAVLANARPGVRLTEIMSTVKGLFETLGYPEERTNHLHGGPTGYRVGYAERSLDPTEVVKPNMALGWYLTVKGAKCEEVILVDEQGAGFITVDPAWPVMDLQVQGQTVAVPDILQR